MLDTPPETGASCAETRHVEQNQLATWVAPVRRLERGRIESSELLFFAICRRLAWGKQFQDESRVDAFLGDLVNPITPMGKMRHGAPFGVFSQG